MLHRFPRQSAWILVTSCLCGSTFSGPALAEEQRSGANSQLHELTVTATPQLLYESQNADSLLRIQKNIADVPRTIEVLPEQMIIDQQAHTLEDVFRLSPNVVSSDGYGGTADDFYIWGFRRAGARYRNGVRIDGTTGRVNLINVSSVQIIKGSVADIGQMPPGGLINIETKKPLFFNQRTISASFDRFGQRKYDLDITGPLGESQNLAYRVVASYENSDNFRHVPVDQQFFSPSLAWQGDSGASISLSYEYSRDRRQLDRGLITAPTGHGKTRRIVDAPRDQRYDNPDFNRIEGEHHLVEIDTSTPLGTSNWRWENKLFYFQERSPDLRSEVRDVLPLQDGILLNRTISNHHSDAFTKFLRTQLTGNFVLGVPIRIASGIEYYNSHSAGVYSTGSWQPVGTINHPYVSSIVNDIDFRSGDYDIRKNISHAIFTATDFSFTDTLSMNLGLRYEEFRSRVQRNDFASGVVAGATGKPLSTEIQSKFTTGVGLLWKATPEVSLFANYADTYNPQYIDVWTPKLTQFDPEEGRQYEIGARWSSADRHHYVNVSLFDIDQKNVVKYVDGDPQLFDGISSRGVELSIVSNPFQGFNLRGTLGYLDAQAASPDPATDGNRPGNIPHVTASLWSSYEFSGAQSPLNGLGIGAGVTYVSNRYGDTEHSFELGGYTVVDLGAWYYMKTSATSRVRFDAGVKNLTDKRYYTASGGYYRINVGAPRTLFASVRYEF